MKSHPTALYGHRITSIFFIFIEGYTLGEQVLIDAWDYAYPALKIVVLFAAKNSEHAKEFWFLVCSKYCTEAMYSFEDLSYFKRIITYPLNFHKEHFWGGNKKVVKAIGVGYQEYLSYYSESNERTLPCFTYVATAKYNSVASFCESKLMTVVYLSKAHNMTFDIMSHFIEKEMKSINSTVPGEIVAVHGIKLDKAPPHLKSGISYASTAHSNIMYCKLRNPEKISMDVQFWTHTFPPSIWLLIFTAVVISIFMFSFLRTTSKPRTYQIFNFIRASFGQSINDSFNKNFIYFIIFALLVRNLFENTLTSVIVAPPPPELYSDLKSMIQDEVKIVVNPLSFPFTKPEKNFEVDFSISGILNRINESFYVLSEKEKNEYVKSTVDFLQNPGGRKYASLLNSGHRKADLYYATITVRNRTRKSISCYYLSTKLNPEMNMWTMYMVNRDWLRTSIGRMRDAGLQQIWDKWIDDLRLVIYQARLRSLEMKFTSERSFEEVNIPKLSLIALFGFSVCCVAFFSLLVELALE